MTDTTGRFRSGTVIWGAALLVLAAISFGIAVFDLRAFQTDAVIWIITGLGGLFVVAAIAAAIARTGVEGRRVSTGSTRETGSTVSTVSTGSTSETVSTGSTSETVSTGSTRETGSTSAKRTRKDQPVD